jgi:uncharacterized protein YeaO (DUF488 family)
VTTQIGLKRAYEPPGSEDGYRVLVDRIWPRGVKRDALHLDRWLREVAPDNDLRRWFGHRADRWLEFRRRYLIELVHGSARTGLDALLAIAHEHPVTTLLFGAHDPDHNQAVVLRDVLELALAKGLPTPRPDLVGALADVDGADLGSLERLTRERLAATRDARSPADVQLVAALPAYVEARSSGLCHDGALEAFADALRTT